MLFELDALGGPISKRLARRRTGTEHFAWHQLGARAGDGAAELARGVWTQSAFSEYASAAAFAEIAAGLLACGAPIDLSAAAGDFVVDELLHAELSARLAMALGGAVELEVDLTRLVRPPAATTPLLGVAERIVRTCCIGESLTVALLAAAQRAAEPAVVRDVIGRLARDEAEHAALGWVFLDWAAERLSAQDRAQLGEAAAAAIQSFSPLFAPACATSGALGVMSCAAFDPVFRDALERHVLAPLALRGIRVPDETPGGG